MNVSRRMRRAVGVAGMLAALMSGCAEERPAINQVGSNVLDKTFLVGESLAEHNDDPEFYWRNYVVDGSASQSLIGIGSWSGIERIRWEVTEELLLARKAYQTTPGADNKGLPDGDPNGTVVAAYAIKKHFDIRRSYNPSTGEEMNVFEENSRDRTWNERRYMRVDWSQNLVDTPLWLDMFIGKMFGSITVTPIAHAVVDPDHDDAPHFETDDGYFDITSRYFIAPEESSLVPGLPTCVLIGLYTGSASYECDAQEAIVRSSYWRIDPDNDFERLEMTNAPRNVVGNPAALSGSLYVGMAPPGHQGWDPGYGYTDELFHRFAHIHNVWEKSHIDASCTSNDDADNDGTADACAPSVANYSGSLGSQCDTFAEKCTIPYRDRQIKPVAYWLNKDMPADLQDTLDGAGKPTVHGASEDVISGWNQLLKNSVARAREVECRRTGGDIDQCKAELFEGDEMVSYGAFLIDKPRDGTDVLVTCHNPVRSYDPEVCGKEGTKARLGDVRRNFLAYWPHASRAPWGGIGNWGADPLTGEIIGGAAMIMGRSATHAAAQQRDIIQLALGDLDIEDIIDGAPAELYAQYLTEGKPEQALSVAEMDRRIQSVDADSALSQVLPAPLQGNSIAEKFQSLSELQATATNDVEAVTGSQTLFNSLAEPLRDTPYEAQLVSGQWLSSMAGLSPNSSLNEEVLNAASPLRGLDPGLMRAVSSRIDTMMQLKGVCFNEHEAPALGSDTLQGLAKYFGEKYPAAEFSPTERGERIYQDLKVEAYKGIAVHEVGHSLGLLHNFASSWDASNFHPQYWQLRSHEGTSQASCEGLPRTGDTSGVASDDCMGPRYLDPRTDDERGVGDEARPDMAYFANSSVMEYSHERFAETVGLGSYDLQAMKALYGRVLETFADESHGGMDQTEQAIFAPRVRNQIGNDDAIIRSDGPFPAETFAKPTHYTELARRMQVFNAAQCRDATEQEKAQAEWRLVHGKVCANSPRDHAAWMDFEHNATPLGSGDNSPFVRTREDAKTGGNDIRWLYRYGTASNSYLHTQPGDAGADAYETTMSSIERWDAQYPWNYFRRKNRSFFSPSLPGRASSRLFERLRSQHWVVASRTAFYRGISNNVFNEVANSDDWHKPLLMAEVEMFNALARTILSPQPGDLGPMDSQPAGNTKTIFDADTQSVSVSRIEIPDGRFIDPDFDSSANGGGSWDYQDWIVRAGFSSEKGYAAMALTDGRPVLSTISRENYLDPRGSNISFRSDMPKAVDRLIGGVLAEDWDAVGMYFTGTGAVVPQMTPIHLANQEPTRPENSLVLFGNVGFTQQLNILVFAHLYSRMGTDMALSNKLRLWIDGQSDTVAVPEDQQLRFYHPDSGFTYIARRYGDEVIDGKSVDRGIGSRMLRHANELMVMAYKTQTDVDGNVIVDAFGTPQFDTDAGGQHIVVNPQRAGELTRYVGLLDAARQIAAILGQGPL